ncbi:hypothetical protein J437_LFUL017047 [Ladona fulva]|uniref:SLC41A/MgtE integral membrane domain-containing protein n=1 Tax=Ladona fulva TaxID=123851 RepID=A0A8K0KND3_LADFU|nr:hypothetical protein J437_LFUL017047 [Ladona fulva]
MVAFLDSTAPCVANSDPVILNVGILSSAEEEKKSTAQSLSSGGSLATIASLATSSSNEGSSHIEKEKWWSTLMQVAVPFLIAGVGTIGAGLVLGMVQHWPVFMEVSELFILVPALLGLKGNLDMCLASRLSTQTNLGNMETAKEIWKIVIGNIALVQVIINQNLHKNFVMIAVILLSHRLKMNPDNVATPLAASFGDVVSITLLSNVASLLYSFHDAQYYILFGILACYLLLLPFWVWLTHRNPYTKPVLKTGWVPVLCALLISGFGGLVLDSAVSLFDGFVIFQPIINGIGGNLVSVQASRISTMLHQTSLIGILPPHAKMCIPPWKALFTSPHARTARILIGMSVPGQLVFIFAADYIYNSEVSLSAPFVFSYLFVSVLQIMLLLYIAHLIIHLMWRWKFDPDNGAIPYLTSLGDLLGSGLLACAFLFLHEIGYDYMG